jgi:hypothetical protein
MMTHIMRRSIKEMTEHRKQQSAQESRDFFQRPRIPDRPEHSAGWDAKSEWSGSAWSGDAVERQKSKRRT